jgi:hypothetical protein
MHLSRPGKETFIFPEMQTFCHVAGYIRFQQCSFCSRYKNYADYRPYRVDGKHRCLERGIIRRNPLQFDVM